MLDNQYAKTNTTQLRSHIVQIMIKCQEEKKKLVRKPEVPCCPQFGQQKLKKNKTKNLHIHKK